jgi:hypothetical protein
VLFGIIIDKTDRRRATEKPSDLGERAARLAEAFSALSAEEDRALLARLSRADPTELDVAIRERYEAIRALESDVGLLHEERRARVAGRPSVLDPRVVLSRLPERESPLEQ